MVFSFISSAIRTYLNNKILLEYIYFYICLKYRFFDLKYVVKCVVYAWSSIRIVLNYSAKLKTIET